MSDTPNVGLVIFHCIFQADGSITHYEYEFPATVYAALSHLYLVSVAERKDEHVHVLGCFFLRTNFTREDPGFDDALLEAYGHIDSFAGLNLDSLSLWSSKLGNLPEEEPPSEREMLIVAQELFVRIDTRGRA